jgi:hypothetical protein
MKAKIIIYILLTITLFVTKCATSGNADSTSTVTSSDNIGDFEVSQF